MHAQSPPLHGRFWHSKKNISGRKVVARLSRAWIGGESRYTRLFPIKNISLEWLGDREKNSSLHRPTFHRQSSFLRMHPMLCCCLTFPILQSMTAQWHQHFVTNQIRNQHFFWLRTQFDWLINDNFLVPLWFSPKGLGNDYINNVCGENCLDVVNRMKKMTCHKVQGGAPHCPAKQSTSV